jgi:hypothetical protein
MKRASIFREVIVGGALLTAAAAGSLPEPTPVLQTRLRRWSGRTTRTTQIPPAASTARASSPMQVQPFE